MRGGWGTVSSPGRVAGHVSISYMREDSYQVDQLQRMLQAAGIPVWRDTADLWPGEDWRAKIRRAITDNALVFIACFSRANLARGTSYQNEELTLAIEQMRLRRPDDPWLIPVRFDDCDIPDRDIGGGRTLTSIQRADLLSDRFDEGVARLVTAILRILGGHSDADAPEGERDPDAPTSLRNPIRFRLPRVARHFTGREELLSQLETVLAERRAGVITQMISGLGGVGKTQAAAYVKAHSEDFDIAAWVRAEDGGIADLVELAGALANPTGGRIPAISVQGRTPSERLSDVLTFLSNTDQRWLLVLDNVPGPEALERIPSSGHGRVLVTSRHRGGYDAFGDELPVDVFDAATACRYLLARSGRTNEEADAETVATALGCLPLALSHAGAYCAAGAGVSFREYLELLESLPSQDMFDTSPDVFYQHTVAATWNTSISAAQERAQLARRALQMISYRPPRRFPDRSSHC